MSLRFHEIAEGDHRILNPFTHDKLMLLGEVCRLQPGMTKSLIGERTIGIVMFRNPAALQNELPIPILGGNEDLAFYLTLQLHKVYV